MEGCWVKPGCWVQSKLQLSDRTTSSWSCVSGGLGETLSKLPISPQRLAWGPYLNLRNLSFLLSLISGIFLIVFLRIQSNILKRHRESQSESLCKCRLADWLSLSRPLRNFNFINSAKIFFLLASRAL